MTREVAAVFTAVGIDLHDHVVAARGGAVSSHGVVVTGFRF